MSDSVVSKLGDETSWAALKTLKEKCGISGDSLLTFISNSVAASLGDGGWGGAKLYKAFITIRIFKSGPMGPMAPVGRHVQHPSHPVRLATQSPPSRPRGLHMGLVSPTGPTSYDFYKLVYDFVSMFLIDNYLYI